MVQTDPEELEEAQEEQKAEEALMDPRLTVFTEEALKAQDGKKVPLTDKFGGNVIGEAIMRYDEATGELRAQIVVTDPIAAEFLVEGGEAIIFRKD